MKRLTDNSARPASRNLRLGFACNWRKDRRLTWSHTPFSLLRAFEAVEGVLMTDIDAALSPARRLLHQLAGARIVGGELKSTYLYTPAYVRALHRNFDRRVGSTTGLDAILTIGDLGVSEETPFYPYMDWSIALAMRLIETEGRLTEYEMLTPRLLKRRLPLEQKTFDNCAGIFAMSSWLARSLVEESGVPACKVHIVHAGVNVRLEESDIVPLEGRKRTTILFIGRNFRRKGGDLVYQAFRELRREHSPAFDLVFAGPSRWPFEQPIPDGVTFLGNASWDALRKYFRLADVFCLPSRLEGFGIVLAEALCCGIPCIAKNNSAMTDIVKPGVNGYLLDSNAPRDLAELIVRIADDRALRQRVRDDMREYRSYYSWDRVARDMISAISDQ
jgi:glycosyltransferase involved in cell wall biosynthesis